MKKNQKGLSGVITALIMIALVLVAVGIVWGVVNKLIRDKMESTEACFGNYNKVTLNGIYTCYEYLGVGDYNVHFSLNIGDIEVDSVLVSISSAGKTNVYTLIDDEVGIEVDGLGNYPTPIFGVDLIKLPGENGGETYIADGFSEEPDLIQIIPIINEEQCEVSDTISNIELCF